MDQLNRQVLEDFEAVVSFPIINYFVQIQLFFDKHANNINLYYSGKTKTLNTKSFELLNELKAQTDLLLDTWRLNQTILTNYKYWSLIEHIESIYTTLLSLQNSARWHRSTRGLNDFSTQLPIEIPLNQGQTLESLSADILGSNNYDNDWADLALSNDLEEEDYTPDGGILISANLNKNTRSIAIQSVMDVMQGENILGKDILKKLTYTDNDLETVDGRDCFFQAIDILVNLRKGQNPEYRSLGVNDKLMVGSNLNNITYPTIFRDLTEVFRTDDTIKAFSITNINRNTEAVSIDIEVESRLNETQDVALIF